MRLVIVESPYAGTGESLFSCTSFGGRAIPDYFTVSLDDWPGSAASFPNGGDWTDGSNDPEFLREVVRAVKKLERRRNERYLRACLRDCLLRGEAPFASHGLYTQPGVLDDDVPEERELGIRAGFEWRAWADATVVYTDLGVSGGMRRGIDDASDLSAHEASYHEIEYRELGEGWDE